MICTFWQAAVQSTISLYILLLVRLLMNYSSSDYNISGAGNLIVAGNVDPESSRKNNIFITSCVYYNLGKAASKVAKYLCASYVRYQLYWWIAMLVSNLWYISSKIIELNNLNKLLWCIINFLFSPVGWVIFFVTCRWCCSIQNDLLGTDCSKSIATVTPADQKTVLHPKNY